MSKISTELIRSEEFKTNKELEIGTYDGKILYRKIFTLNVFPKVNEMVSTQITLNTSIAKIINIYGIITRGDEDICSSISYIPDDFYSNVFYRSNTLQIRIKEYTKVRSGVYTFNICFEYTKE